jgi:hypothetical protein
MIEFLLLIGMNLSFSLYRIHVTIKKMDLKRGSSCWEYYQPELPPDWPY